MTPAHEPWFSARTWSEPAWTASELVAAKAGRTVSVVLPALDEQATVAGVVGAVTPLHGTLVDEVVVVDSGSTDATVARARAASTALFISSSRRLIAPMSTTPPLHA